jgi:hypothetical protein
MSRAAVKAAEDAARRVEAIRATFESLDEDGSGGLNLGSI